jgi:hypothetical protein
MRASQTGSAPLFRATLAAIATGQADTCLADPPMPQVSIVGAEDYVASCDLGIFVDQVAGSVPPPHAGAGI